MPAELTNNIEKLRSILNRSGSYSSELFQGEMLMISQQLDEWINKYYKKSLDSKRQSLLTGNSNKHSDVILAQ